MCVCMTERWLSILIDPLLYVQIRGDLVNDLCESFHQSNLNTFPRPAATSSISPALTDGRHVLSRL